MVSQVGSGLAGLTAAYLLSLRTQWEVHIFEKADRAGADSANVSVTVFKHGKSVDVGIDVPMRSIDAGLPSSPTKLK
jgi:predicted NAD/FAD-binding protein